MKRSFPLLFLAASLLTLPLQAGVLTEAQVTRIINTVQVVHPASGERPAALRDTIKDDLAVKTGVKSRSELLFQDQTLTRLGPETSFSFTAGTRDLSLQEGTMLLQVPKGLGGAKIRTAAVTAAITGTTIMMEYRPKQNIKVLVLEGSLRLSVNGRVGDSLLLLPGQMVIMPPNAKRIPEPVAVDIARVVKTSALVKMGGTDAALPSMALIEREIANQSKDKTDASLVQTNLVIQGEGTKVTFNDDVLLAMEKKSSAEPELELPTPISTPAPSPTPASSATPGATPASTPSPSATPAPTPPTGGGDDDDDDDDSSYDRVVKIGDDDEGDVTVKDPIDLSGDGRHGKVKINSKGTVTVRTSVKVSESAGSTPSSRGGRIEVTSHKKNGTAIAISDSGQLLALLSAAAPGPGGRITFQSAGGAINVSGGKLQADRGTIDIKNTGQNGVITLDQATLNGGTVKVRALGKNGQLNLGGGTISADTAIQLYAGGSNGEVNFVDNVTLSGTSAKTISGNTVTIRDGKIVTIQGNGPASVFTNNPNYTGSGGNGSTTGTFGGQGATPAPLSSEPGR